VESSDLQALLGVYGGASATVDVDGACSNLVSPHSSPGCINRFFQKIPRPLPHGRDTSLHMLPGEKLSCGRGLQLRRAAALLGELEKRCRWCEARLVEQPSTMMEEGVNTLKGVHAKIQRIMIKVRLRLFLSVRGLSSALIRKSVLDKDTKRLRTGTGAQNGTSSSLRGSGAPCSPRSPKRP
jgi:hypothetical protein